MSCHVLLRRLMLFLTIFCSPMLLKADPPKVDPYISKSYFTSIPFGAHSYWLQPWRAYMETVPAVDFVKGVGINLGGTVKNPDLIAEMLAKYGFRHLRIEIGWVSLDYDTEQIPPAVANNYRKILLACKKYNIRPLILLNGNSGAPCPVRFFNKVLAAPAHKGDREVQVTDVDGIIPGYSGISNLTDYWAAEALVIAIHGNTLVLSKPLPKDLGDSGASISMATLKYRPFSVPGSDDDRRTLAGWQHYVGTVARFVAQTLGTVGTKDLGFDMEIWNELSFGSHFLYINQYYDPPIYHYNEDAVWGDVVRATADYAEQHPAEFQGVALCDGFSNTIPWPASSQEPARVIALSKHPYHGRSNYPQDEQHGVLVNALGQQEPVGAFEPHFSALFPEYFATALQTECLERDAGPITNDIYRVAHGRYARVIDGHIVPCYTWITEVNMAPNEQGITDRRQALMLKAKTTARYLCFLLNKGIRRIYFFAALGGDLGLGLLQDNFLAYANTHTAYPADDRAYVSPALQVVHRIVMKMQEGLDPSLVKTRPLAVLSWKGGEQQKVFVGDGSPAHPDLTYHDLFTFLPYQVNQHRFVIPYYVMTYDVVAPFKQETFVVKIGGVEGVQTQAFIYDPFSDNTIPVHVIARDVSSITVAMPAEDYPRLLILQER
ncbi:hypothetical protein CWRG_00413 [Chthonomonas calidirosea]|uniref:hypothetical protein n=1 Tax=Chthonomonas calidirosea TaxID=454171 RepID=UPI0006DD4388|nr:hypothetical protein [Chthonomonas calidirosea]CEK13211.1 hypothetical protein CWRG_00413 [Chthonomonas calidirosea]